MILSIIIKNTEFVGVKERWVERGWTRKQMRDRIEELGLTVDSWCVLQPYEFYAESRCKPGDSRRCRVG